MAFLRAITLPGKTSNRYKVPFPSGPYNLGGGGGGGLGMSLQVGSNLHGIGSLKLGSAAKLC